MWGGITLAVNLLSEVPELMTEFAKTIDFSSKAIDEDYGHIVIMSLIHGKADPEVQHAVLYNFERVSPTYAECAVYAYSCINDAVSRQALERISETHPDPRVQEIALTELTECNLDLMEKMADLEEQSANLSRE